ncbi:hypothetical protein [Sphingomonas sp. M1-B02]|uniref:hypothetical protein n=1 Tax=Sphingomonas sp. M1-B02 TaxID=3114300 RepID=UPI0022404F86|nr:hypothetical protein [Sphingomonas sp. S6-11]UZK65250.1 hypothetical protein OKW87_12090 [Sphingomonas sp. S6-11]
MAVLGGLAAMLLVAVAVLGPIAILIFGQRTVKPAMVLLFVFGTLAMPFAALSEPPDFRGTAVIMTVAFFVVGLVAIAVTGTLRAPTRRGR